MDDWTILQKELDRVEGAILDFGTYKGWRVDVVGRIDRRYLNWCLRTVPLRPEVRRAIIRVLTRPTPSK